MAESDNSNDLDKLRSAFKSIGQKDKDKTFASSDDAVEEPADKLRSFLKKKYDEEDDDQADAVLGDDEDEDEDEEDSPAERLRQLLQKRKEAESSDSDKGDDEDDDKEPDEESPGERLKRMLQERERQRSSDLEDDNDDEDDDDESPADRLRALLEKRRKELMAERDEKAESISPSYKPFHDDDDEDEEKPAPPPPSRRDREEEKFSEPPETAPMHEPEPQPQPTRPTASAAPQENIGEKWLNAIENSFIFKRVARLWKKVDKPVFRLLTIATCLSVLLIVGQIVISQLVEIKIVRCVHNGKYVSASFYLDILSSTHWFVFDKCIYSANKNLPGDFVTAMLVMAASAVGLAVLAWMKLWVYLRHLYVFVLNIALIPPWLGLLVFYALAKILYLTVLHFLQRKS